MKLSELNKSQLGSVQQRFALASDVYNDSAPEHQLNGGWQRAFTSAEVPGLGDRGFYGAVYKRTIDGKDEHVIAFRGMDDIRDLDDVAELVLGTAPGQLSDAYRFAMEAAQKLKFNPASAEYIGHSMGGYLSKAVGLLNGSQKIMAFNSPGLFRQDPQELPRRIQEEFGENKADITMRQISESVLSIDSKFDFVSWLGSLRGNTLKISTRGRQHELSSLEESFSRAAEGIQNNTLPRPQELPERPTTAVTARAPAWGATAAFA